MATLQWYLQSSSPIYNTAESKLMILHPNLKKWLKQYYMVVNKLEAEGFKATPTNAREGLANLTHSLVRSSPTVQWVQDDLVTGEVFDVPVRIYNPSPEESLPVLIYLHGGGHMAGSVTVYDPICRKIAVEARHIVVSPDYRLAPECPYPAGINDALQVVQNIWSVLEARQLRYKRQLSIAGDSAGGAMSATVAHRVQNDQYVQIHRQVLIYPSLDYTMSFDSIDSNGQGYLLHNDKIAWYFSNYLKRKSDRKDISPLFMSISANYPPTLLVSAEFCPLRDENLAYVKKLNKAAIDAKHVHFDTMIHAFLNMEKLVPDECQRLYQKLDSFLNATMAT